MFIFMSPEPTPVEEPSTVMFPSLLLKKLI